MAFIWRKEQMKLFTITHRVTQIFKRNAFGLHISTWQEAVTEAVCQLSALALNNNKTDVPYPCVTILKAQRCNETINISLKSKFDITYPCWCDITSLTHTEI